MWRLSRKPAWRTTILFGASVEELNAIRNTYWARGIYDSNPRLRRAINTLVDGTVPTDDEQRELFTALLDGASWHRPDHYFILKDYDSYLEAKLRANRDYADRLAFGRKCLDERGLRRQVLLGPDHPPVRLRVSGTSPPSSRNPPPDSHPASPRF